jgi:hypothetical protein
MFVDATPFQGINPYNRAHWISMSDLALFATTEVVKLNIPYYSRSPSAGPVANTNKR